MPSCQIPKLLTPLGGETLEPALPLSDRLLPLRRQLAETLKSLAELLAPWTGATVDVPALYVAGDRDLVLAFRGMDQLLPNLKRSIPKLVETIILPGCGHWTQQERPDEVNAALCSFLNKHYR